MCTRMCVLQGMLVRIYKSPAHIIAASYKDEKRGNARAPDVGKTPLLPKRTTGTNLQCSHRTCVTTQAREDWFFSSVSG